MWFGKSKVETIEQTPTEKVERALGVFTEAKNDLEKLCAEFEAEKAILAEKLQDVKTQSDRIAGTLDKLKDLCG